ncbi:MAG: ferritin [Candidatus Zophobacter franzmannii]|jgi:ferritin|nr:ferritin [Candidatus Zophobacter franzmannii]
MITKKLEKEMNDQINREFYSAYLYLSMSAWFKEQNFDGFANWMNVQYQEESFHAMKLFEYVVERGGKIVLQQIDQPDNEFESVTKIFELTLEHERFITGCINNLMNVAIEEKDHAAKSFLQWYIDEQVEEEANADKLLQTIKMVKANPHTLYMMDKELTTRSFTPPAPV